MIERILQSHIQGLLERESRIIVIFGPRQVGKTTLVNTILAQLAYTVVKANGDELRYHDVFKSRDLTKMLDFVGNRQLLFIDEAHMISEIGLNLKILYDHRTDLKIVITGSSSLDLASRIKEPLTGRTVSIHLYPISIGELSRRHTHFELRAQLDDMMTYGMYPAVVNTSDKAEKISLLRELISSYLYRDILMVSNIRNSDKIFKLLQLLAYQIGNLVSVHEIAQKLSLSSEAVNAYITLLEQSFIVFRLSALSNNERKEVSKMSKIYFYDLGVRNALIDDFRPMETRTDRGAIFENFIIMERIKYNSYHHSYARYYYWRTYGGAEVDLVESYDGMHHGYEIKMGSKKARTPKSWMEQHPNSTHTCIHNENYLTFIS
jgi:uncharacterized protein